MATETITKLRDDIDGSDADRTVRFAWDGVAYEIDLSAQNVQALEQALARFVAAARRVSPARSGRGSRAVAARKPSSRRNRSRTDLAAVRAWAIANGHTVAERGRISNSVIEAYQAAQGGTDGAAPAAGPRQATARKAVSRSGRAGRPAKKAAAKAARGRRPAKKQQARPATATSS